MDVQPIAHVTSARTEAIHGGARRDLDVLSLTVQADVLIDLRDPAVLLVVGVGAARRRPSPPLLSCDHRAGVAREGVEEDHQRPGSFQDEPRRP